MAVWRPNITVQVKARGLMLPGRAGPLNWNHWTCSNLRLTTETRNLLRPPFFCFIQRQVGKYFQSINGGPGLSGLSGDLWLRFEQTPIASSGRGCGLEQVIGNLSIEVSSAVMPSGQPIGRYWSKLDLPITSDQPIQSIFLIGKFVVFRKYLHNKCVRRNKNTELLQVSTTFM